MAGQNLHTLPECALLRSFQVGWEGFSSKTSELCVPILGVQSLLLFSAPSNFVGKQNQ